MNLEGQAAVARERPRGVAVGLDLLAAAGVVAAVITPAKLGWYPSVEAARKAYVGMWAIVALLAFSR